MLTTPGPAACPCCHLQGVFSLVFREDTLDNAELMVRAALFLFSGLLKLFSGLLKLFSGLLKLFF